MKFPGGFNIQQMMKQAQVMQEKMQKEMEELRVEASAGGGVVTVEMKGKLGGMLPPGMGGLFG